MSAHLTRRFPESPETAPFAAQQPEGAQKAATHSICMRYDERLGSVPLSRTRLSAGGHIVSPTRLV